MYENERKGTYAYIVVDVLVVYVSRCLRRNMNIHIELCKEKKAKTSIQRSMCIFIFRLSSNFDMGVFIRQRKHAEKKIKNTFNPLNSSYRAQYTFYQTLLHYLHSFALCINERSFNFLNTCVFY